MKTKTVLFTVIAALLLVGGMGCEKEKDTPRLTNTKWQLVGIMDVKTGDLKSLAPEGGYWFKFITETEAKGRSVFNDMGVNLTTPPFFGIITKVGDDHNGDAALFYSVIQKLESYTWEGKTLKFFYDNKQRYLLYKLSEL